MAKIVNIEWMEPTRQFKCPCCAAKVLNAMGKVVSEPCQHFLFSWDSVLENFEDSTSDVESVLDDASLDAAGPFDRDLIESLPDSSILFEIVIRDEALGPVVCTDVVAFDPMAA